MLIDVLTFILLCYLAFCLFVFCCHLPVLPIIRVLQSNASNKQEIIKCFIEVWLKNMIVFIPDMLAPLIVPIALLFTKWEDEHLPSLFKPWDNDASINGDVRTDDSSDGFAGWGLRKVPLENTPEAIAMNYWAEGSSSS